MPIYAYRCSSCGHAQDVLQKISDEPLTVCTACGAASFAKQLTAAGFLLKGSGWYATDFKNGSGPKKDPGSDGAAAGDKAGEKPADKPADKPAAAPAKAGTEAAATAPACGSGGCAACS